jgi:single stranded DNA-binding protein
MNTVSITGNVGRDPDVKTFQDTGRKTCVLSIATKRRTTRRKGEKESTDWHRVVITDTGLIESYIEPYIRKGALIAVTGELVYENFRKRDANGVPEERETKLAQIVVTDPRGVIIHRMSPKTGFGMLEANDDDIGADVEPHQAEEAETA